MTKEDIIRAENEAEIMRRKLAEAAKKEEERKNQKYKDLFNELIKLNPSISFFRTVEDDSIIISAPLEKIKLPEGFERVGNKITNIKTANIENVIEMGFKFEKTKVSPKLGHQNDEIAANKFFDELVKLNPDANLKISIDRNYINSSKEIEDMILPKGFYNFNGTISNATVDGTMDSLQFPVLVEQLVKEDPKKEEIKTEEKKGFFEKFKVKHKDAKDTTLNKKKQKHNKEKTKVFSKVPKFIARIWESKAIELLIKKPVNFTVKSFKYIGKGIKKCFVSSKNFICKLTKKQKQEKIEPEVEASDIDKVIVLEAMLEELKQKYEEEKNGHLVDINKISELEAKIKELTEELEKSKKPEPKVVNKGNEAPEKNEETKKVVRVAPEASLDGYSFDALKNIYENIEIISIEGGVAARNKNTKAIYEGTKIISKYQMAVLWAKANGENAFAEENRTTFNYFISVAVNMLSVTHNLDEELLINSLQGKEPTINSQLISKMFEQYGNNAKNIIAKYSIYALQEKVAEIDKKRYQVEVEKEQEKEQDIPNMKDTQKTDTNNSKIVTVPKTTKEKMSTKSKIYGFEKSIGTAFKEGFINQEEYGVSAYYTHVAKTELTEETDFMINEINKYAKNLLNSLKKGAITNASYDIGIGYCIQTIEELTQKKDNYIKDALENHKIAIKNLKDYKEHKNDVVYRNGMINCMDELKRLSEEKTEVRAI